MHLHRLAWLLNTLVLVAGARAQDAPAPVDATTLKPGDAVAGEMLVNGKRIVVPAGQWQLVSRTERNPSRDGSSKVPLMLTWHLSEVLNGRLERMLEIVTNASSARVHWLAEPCKEPRDAYFIEVREATYDTHDCTRVGFYSGVVDGMAGTPLQGWAEDLRRQGVAYSTDMPFVLVVRYTRTNYVRMTMAFHPALAGIEPQPASSRATSAWSPAGLASRPAQQAFYEALRVWSAQYADGVHRAHAGDRGLKPADYGRPQFTRQGS